EQFLIAVEPHRYVIDITLAVLEPASQPLVNGLPARTGCTVGTRSDKEFDAVLSSIEPVPAPGLLVHHSGPRWREIVLFGRLNQPRRRSGQLHEIRRIQPNREVPRKRHFRMRIGSRE